MIPKEMRDFLKMSESFEITMDGNNNVVTVIKGSGESVMKFEQEEMTAEADNSPCENVPEPEFHKPDQLEVLMIVEAVSYVRKRTYQVVQVGLDEYILHNLETGGRWTNPMSLVDLYTELETAFISWKVYKNAKLQIVHG